MNKIPNRTTKTDQMEFENIEELERKLKMHKNE